MALIDGPLLEIPEEDGWQDDLAGRLLLVLLGAMMFGTAFRFWSGVAQTNSFILGVCSFVLMGFGVQLLVISVADVDLERVGRPLAIVTVLLLTGIVLVAIGATKSAWVDRLSTDVLMFASYSADLVLAGQNPYAQSMAPAHSQVPGWMMTDYLTWRTDGTLVTSYSYPAGSFLAFVPQVILMGHEPIGIRLTSILATGVLGLLLALMLPAEMAVAAPISMLAGRNLWLTAAGGVIKSLWLVPFCAGLWCWADRRWMHAAALVGLAASIKQFAWLSVPFLVLWAARTRGLRPTFRIAAVGVGVFGLVNAPFLIADPAAWLTGVFTPLGSSGAPLELAGSGFVALALGGAPIPRWGFTVAVATVGIASLTGYWIWFDRVRWVAWIVPPVILLWHDRSLMSYFISFVPVAVIAATASWDRLEPVPTTDSVRTRVREVLPA